ncbi:hypothetical protein ACFY0F_30010 [Streptomyces sp. NPDC001544]|uniref:hypothetical protein n=1 Tax=Streptomyces sp. NPDC001544 TaxID=3364584 RepID=UPI00369C2321
MDGPRHAPRRRLQPGALGLGSQCAFSKQLAGAFQDEYEGDNIAALLKAGHLDGQTHRYMSATNAGHALLDMARAATAVPGSGLSPQTRVPSGSVWTSSTSSAAPTAAPGARSSTPSDSARTSVPPPPRPATASRSRCCSTAACSTR